MPKTTSSPHLRRLGMRIKELRDDCGLTQAELSRFSGVSRVYLSGIECGIRNLTFLHFLAIARGLNVQPEELLQ